MIKLKKYGILKYLYSVRCRRLLNEPISVPGNQPTHLANVACQGWANTKCFLFSFLVKKLGPGMEK